MLQSESFIYVGMRKYFQLWVLAAAAGLALLLTGNSVLAADEIFTARSYQPFGIFEEAPSPSTRQ
jgi:hypothetical protein